MHDILEFTEREKIRGLMVAIDFKKAFDSVNRNFMLETLSAFNFGPTFIRWIRTFYQNITSSVMNNGFSTGPFNIRRGVRQSDPLSPYLFIICLETLAIIVRGNKNIQGIGPLQDPVTWYRINYTGTQMTQWDFQNKGILTSPARLSFVLKVPLHHLRPSVIYSVPCDGILQRAYSSRKGRNKLEMFADDVTAFLRNTRSFEALLHTADLFSKCSGLEINPEKTECMVLGNQVSSTVATVSKNIRITA